MLTCALVWSANGNAPPLAGGPPLREGGAPKPCSCARSAAAGSAAASSRRAVSSRRPSGTGAIAGRDPADISAAARSKTPVSSKFLKALEECGA